MTLAQALCIGEREVISLAGGGGKTTLMYALGRELSSRRNGIILTTTTKILEPEPSPFFIQFLSNDLGGVKKWVAENSQRRICLLIARGKLPDSKLAGVPPDWIEEIFRMDGVSVIVNEADGAAGRPLKALRAGEPVIPKNTTLLLPIIGIDGMCHPLNEEWVFRSAIASRLLNLPIGSMITQDVMARLMKELMESAPAGARIVPIINKIDVPGGLANAQKLAGYLLSTASPRIRRIILCRLRHTPVVKVIEREDIIAP